MHDSDIALPGGCACGNVRYEVRHQPLIVHCCHCRWCQRQTGTAFALNALFVASDVEVISGKIEEIVVDSPSGQGQTIARCPNCKVAVWSNYYMGGLKEKVRFIRVGTLDNPDLLPPDVHIYTSTKQPWVIIPPHHYAVEELYDIQTTWSPESYRRRKALEAEVSEV